MSPTELNDEQLSRYSRHLLLPEIDLAGQARLNESSAAIIGAGGLGAPAAMYLAGSGIGHITIIDDDVVDLGNLQRQIAFRTSDISQPKASRLGATLRALNPDIQVHTICARADTKLLNQLAENTDILLDCCDNFSSRFAINQASLKTKTPLVSGAAIRFQGQVTVFNPSQKYAPCYRCLYHEETDTPQETCNDRGVFAPLVGIIGSIQAAEAIKTLLDIGHPLTGRLLIIDTLNMTLRQIKLHKDPHCSACSASE